ncbi:hypothetical protein [Delftia sp. DS1230]|uniref:hypothetical protein n=1 Tax=Delftia sp. DS1230 TaxID=3153805 RepID=UPI0032D9A50F
MQATDIAQIRKSLIWSISSFLLILALSIWSIKYSFLNTIIDLKSSSASVRITPLHLAIVYFPVISVTGIIAMIQKSIPCKEPTLKIAERIFAFSVFTGTGVVLLCFFVITPLQYYAMPKLGYTRCNILKDHPTIYFTDWVKNPDWCVRGKSREWVNEQARLPNDSDHGSR